VPGTQEWEDAASAFADIASTYKGIVSTGTKITTVTPGGTGTQPFEAMLERMDKALIILFRGSDLGTMSSNNATGASLQEGESDTMLNRDCLKITETLREVLDKFVINYFFGNQEVKAYITIEPKNIQNA
jgi:hypothetical protein